MPKIPPISQWARLEIPRPDDETRAFEDVLSRIASGQLIDITVYRNFDGSITVCAVNPDYTHETRLTVSQLRTDPILDDDDD